jgi:lactoylglutathione lyase
VYNAGVGEYLCGAKIMYIKHIAIWSKDIDKLRIFYETYFQAKAGKRYVNKAKQFESYFLNFASGASLELMQKPGISELPDDGDIQFTGYSHLAVSVISKEEVDSLTARLKKDGFQVVSKPRQTGDGYYESCVLDPDENRVEITI